MKTVSYSYKPYGRTKGFVYGLDGLLGSERKKNAERNIYERTIEAHRSLEHGLMFLAGILAVLPDGMLRHNGEKLLEEGDKLIHAWKTGAQAIRKMRVHNETIIRLVNKIHKKGLVFASRE